MGFHMEKNKKYKYSGKINEEELTAFAKSVIDDTAQADFKSAAIPEEPLDDGVSVIVGKSFESIVLDPKKDVLLEVRECDRGMEHCGCGGVLCLKRGVLMRDVRLP